MDNSDIDYQYNEYDLEEAESLRHAINELVTVGNAIPVCLGEVYALIADARNHNAVQQVIRIKKRPPAKPFSVLLSSETISMITDLNRIHDKHKAIFSSPEKINHIFGNKGFIRVPINAELGLESSLIGPGNKIQAFTFHGDPLAFKFENELREELKKKHSNGHGEIMITSYNISGEPSITSQEHAKNLSISQNVCLQINRQTSCGRGSYSIYDFDENGVTKVRDGTGSEYIDKVLAVYNNSLIVK